MMLCRLLLRSELDRAAALSGDEAAGLRLLEEGEDLGSQASSSPGKNDGGPPRRLLSLSLGLSRMLLRLAALNGSVNCVAETVGGPMKQSTRIDEAGIPDAQRQSDADETSRNVSDSQVMCVMSAVRSVAKSKCGSRHRCQGER